MSELSIEYRFKKLPEEFWPLSQFDPKRCAVHISTKFMVQSFIEDNGVIRLSININKKTSNGHWQEGISWDELQLIKNECGYHEHDAVEVYPHETDVVNVANMRHLWVMPERLSFSWKKARKDSEITLEKTGDTLKSKVAINSKLKGLLSNLYHWRNCALLTDEQSTVLHASHLDTIIRALEGENSSYTKKETTHD